MNPAQELILEYLQPQTNSRILILEGGKGWIASKAAKLVPEGEVVSLDRDVRAVWAAQNTLSSVPNASTSMDVFPKSAGWDIVLLMVPKGRRYARTLLVAAYQVLKPNGRLLISGPTKQGAKAVIKDAERLFGNASVLGFRKHQRVATCVRGESFTNPLPKEFQQPGVAPESTHHVEITFLGKRLSLETHPGIFSWEAIDEGTALLLDHLDKVSGLHVWDVGCGYGAIGLSAALAGAKRVLMSDINLLAVDYAHRNSISNGFEGKVFVVAADGIQREHSSLLPGNKRYEWDLILSNPAFHQGWAVDKSMADRLIAQSPSMLAQNGLLLIVANRFLNYDKLIQKYFRYVRKTAETNRFHVIEARN